MKDLTKKKTLRYCLFLLIFSCTLHAAKSVYPPSPQAQKVAYRNVLSPKRKLFVNGYCRAYSIPNDICFFIRCLVYDNPLRYKNRPLPNNLSGQDLSGFDFTGCHFTYTSLIDSNLANVILTNTTCDYQKAFLENIKQHRCDGGNWYEENLPKDLKSITAVYSKLNNDTHKAKLVHIACGLSRLPFYEGKKFYVKVEYWSSELRQLKQTLGEPYSKELVCSLQYELEYDTDNYCWATNYPQDKVNIQTRALHANFDTYLKDFTNGLTNYQCKSKESWGFDWYKNNITKNIEGLAKIYPYIKEAALQVEVCAIAQALSKSYQIQKGAFLNHYLFFQHRLIRLKKSVGIVVKSKIHYNDIKVLVP